MQRQGG
ncbi:hypothetical protein D030_4560A, partial [Vibrio parahaemolyticus AQ3810]